jgi:hypothetical protein
MPIYTVEHNGKVFDIEGPAGATPEQLQAAVGGSAPSATTSDATAATETASAATPRTPLRELARQAGLTGRYAANVVASPLTLGGNVIGKVANAAMGREVFQPSTHVFNQALSKLGLPEAESGIEKFTQGLAESAPALAIPGGFIPQVAGNAMIGAAQAPAGQEVTGGMLGAAGGGAGHVLPKVLASGLPGISQQARQLMNTTGIQPTVGMAVPKLRAVEEFSTGIPVFGEVVKSARQRALSEFADTAIAKAVPGLELPKNATPLDKIDFANDHVSALYYDVLPQVKPEVPIVGLNSVGNIPQGTSAKAFEEGYKRAKGNSYLTDTQQEILDRVYKDRSKNISNYSGEQLKTLDAELGEQIRKYQRGAGTSDLADSLREMQLGLREGIESRLPPELQGKLADANRSYRELIAINDAASKHHDFVTTPSRLSKAIAARDKTPITRLYGDMPDFSRNAQQVLPESVGRGMTSSGIASGIVGGAAATLTGHLPTLIGAAGAGALGATRPVQASLLGNTAMQKILRSKLSDRSNVRSLLGAELLKLKQEQDNAP